MSSIVDLLKKTFDGRRSKNPKYSLRAFARSLGAHPATLSALMAGKRTASPKQILRLLDKLKITNNDIRLRALENAVGPVRIAAPLPAITEIDLARFAVIRDWEHTAILAALDVAPSLDAEGLARNLRLSPAQAKKALERLVSVGLLKSERGRWRSAEPHHWAGPTGVPNEDIQEAHRQHIGKALESLTADPLDAREFSGVTMTVSEKHLPEIKEAIREFSRRIGQIADDGKATSVYRLNIQFFPYARKVTT